jgi:DNA polymerase-3 subunit delta'
MSLQLPAFSPWQQRMYAQTTAALDSGRLGHALLLCGPAQLGKRLLAERLAQRMLCTARDSAGEPCGHCRSCQLFENRYQRDPAEQRPDGMLAHPYGHSGHPDLTFVGYEWNDKARPPRLRTELVIEQIRLISEKLAFTPQYGGAQIVILDPADAINHAACNALLKTLEEPQPGRYLWLISANPSRLPATIRSRCQRLEMRLPPQDEALAWLLAQGHVDATAREALTAARGHPGLADRWLRDGGLELRREIAADLQAIGRGDKSPLDIAKRWADAVDLDQRLRHAADLALYEAGRLTDPVRIRTLATWFDAANRTRDLLRTTVRADLALAELLAQWRGPGKAAGGASQQSSGARR